MTDLAADGDRLYAAALADGWTAPAFSEWCWDNWPAIAAALRERDELARLLHVAEEAFDVDTKHAVATIDALRVRAETAEADADRLAKILTPGFSRAQRADALAVHAAAVEARPKPYVEEIMSDWAND